MGLLPKPFTAFTSKQTQLNSQHITHFESLKVRRTRERERERKRKRKRKFGTRERNNNNNIMNMNMNNQIDQEDHMALLSQLYPGVYTQMVPQQAKPRRRRKKNKGGEGGGCAALKKRKLSAEQVNQLEMNFGNEHKLESERKDRLASELGLDPRQVAVWFQNRRARWKNKKLEEEYSSLKKMHENVVVEKCRLESEVLQLKEQLMDSEKEIQRLAERVEGVSSNSPSSSLSMEAVEPPFLGEFGVVADGFDNMFYAVPENNYIHGMEWVNLYL